ncbi:MAG: HEAT repeat domain-containing protein [Geobacteraceae bacterium]|nr:HEAT repeat domain-containing protein [Geobacteraceae bacterium]
MEFSLLRRYVNIYPRQHPSIAPGARKVIDIFNRIATESGALTIGIAMDELLIADSPLERKNPVFQDVAKSLFAHKIAAVTISPEIEVNELLAFVDIINTSPEKIAGEGGIARAVAAANIRSIQITEIDYGAFRLTEDETVALESSIPVKRSASLLWEKFVRGILNDVLDPQGSPSVTYSRVAPAMLAEIINRMQSETANGRSLSYAQAIVHFIRKAKRDGDGIEKIIQFINHLNPEMRKEFLVSTLEALKDDRKLAGQLLAELTSDAIFDALVEMNNRGETISPYLRALMERLSTLGVSKEVISTASERGDYSRTDLADKLKTILKDDQVELFLPVDYEALIRSILSSGQISVEEMAERELLLSSMAGHPLELQMNAVILDLLEHPSGEDRPEVLKQHIIDMLSYFLGTGDFTALCGIHERLTCNIENQAFRHDLLGFFATPDFINEVLSSVSIWGKAKYDDIKSLISRVGTPFLIPTLDRLAEEESMSLRRFYMERLREFGERAIEPTVARLRDDRWYVVRNMLVLLRTLEATQTVSQLRRLLTHPNSRVHQEALRTLIYFQDPEADRQLLQDLNSDNHDVQFASLQLADTSKSPQVQARLLELLKTSGDFTLRIATLHPLAAIGNPMILPELWQLLKTGSILHPIMMHNLKLEIVRSLERYPALPAGKLLENIPEIGDRELTLLAAEITGKLQTRRP